MNKRDLHQRFPEKDKCNRNMQEEIHAFEHFHNRVDHQKLKHLKGIHGLVDLTNVCGSWGFLIVWVFDSQRDAKQDPLEGVFLHARPRLEKRCKEWMRFAPSTKIVKRERFAILQTLRQPPIYRQILFFLFDGSHECQSTLPSVQGTNDDVTLLQE